MLAVVLMIISTIWPASANLISASSAFVAIGCSAFAKTRHQKIFMDIGAAYVMLFMYAGCMDLHGSPLQILVKFVGVFFLLVMLQYAKKIKYQLAV